MKTKAVKQNLVKAHASIPMKRKPGHKKKLIRAIMVPRTKATSCVEHRYLIMPTAQSKPKKVCSTTAGCAVAAELSLSLPADKVKAPWHFKPPLVLPAGEKLLALSQTKSRSAASSSRLKTLKGM